MGEDVAQGDLGDVVLGRSELGDDGPHPLGDLPLALLAKVAVAEVALLELRLRPDPAGQHPLVEEELVLGALVEDVVDDLHGVHDARLYELDGVRGLVVVDGDAEVTDTALALEILDRLQPAPLADPFILSDVELLHVYRLEAKVLQAPLCVHSRPCSAGKVSSGLRPRRAWPGEVLGRDPRRCVDPLVPLPHGLPDEPLAVPVAVAQSRVYEVQAEVYSSFRALKGSSSSAPIHIVLPIPHAP